MRICLFVGLIFSSMAYGSIKPASPETLQCAAVLESQNVRPLAIPASTVQAWLKSGQKVRIVARRFVGPHNVLSAIKERLRALFAQEIVAFENRLANLKDQGDSRREQFVGLHDQMQALKRNFEKHIELYIAQEIVSEHASEMTQAQYPHDVQVIELTGTLIPGGKTDFSSGEGGNNVFSLMIANNGHPWAYVKIDDIYECQALNPDAAPL